MSDTEGEKKPILASSSSADTSSDDPSKPFSTVEQVIDALQFGSFHMRLYILCGLGVFVDAIEMSMMSVLFAVLKADWHLQNWQIAGMASCTYVGMLFGALILGRLSDQIGRRPIFQFALIVSAIFQLASSQAPDIYWFWIFRAFLGFGYGGSIVTDTVLLAEWLPMKRRGLYLASLDLFFGSGAVSCVLLSWAIIPNLGWRYFLFIAGLLPIFLIVMRQYIPESPRWLVLRRRFGEAKEILLDVARENGESEELVKRIETMSFHDDPSVDVQNPGYFQNMLEVFQPVLLRQSIALLSIWFFFSFASTLFQWVPLYLNEKHEDKSAKQIISDVYVSALFTASGDVVGALSLMAVVMHFSRRVLLGTGLFLLFTFCVAIAIFFNDSIAVLAMITPFAATRSATLALLYTITPEMYPTSIRSTSLGLCMSAHRIGPAMGSWVIAELMDVSFQAMVLALSCLYLISMFFVFMIPYDSGDKPLADQYYKTVNKQESDIVTHQA